MIQWIDTEHQWINLERQWQPKVFVIGKLQIIFEGKTPTIGQEGKTPKTKYVGKIPTIKIKNQDRRPDYS